MTNAFESSAAGEAGQTLEMRHVDGDGLLVVLSGRWCLDRALPSRAAVEQALREDVRRLKFDATSLGAWDSGLLTLLAGVLKASAARGIEVEQDGLPEGIRRLLAMAFAVPEQKVTGRSGRDANLLARVGTATMKVFRGAPAMLRFLGEITLSFMRLLGGRARFRVSDMWLEVEQVGPRALPIVSVISFLVGLILAYLGADQLRLVGAQIFIADLVAIGMVREVGALMTGIIIAGRTGAAFAALAGHHAGQRGDRRLQDARHIAHRFPGAAAHARPDADGAAADAILRLRRHAGRAAGVGLHLRHQPLRVLQRDLARAGAEALLGGPFQGDGVWRHGRLAGCLRGMQCGRSAEAVGEAATSAVVTGILLITIAASVMTIVYYQLEI